MSTAPGALTVTAAPPARYVDHVMGMPVSLALRGSHRDDDLARRAWVAVMADLREADALFSTYRHDSWVSRWNRGEAPPPHPLVEEVLALGAAAERGSGGAFSVHLPGPDGRVRLDPSGVVKGWAVERAARHLRALPGADSCVSVAGDMQCQVASDRSPPWRIGLSDPSDRHRLLATVEVRDGGVATSGTSARGSHVVDGRTHEPAAGLAQVTVVAAGLCEADVRATTALALGDEADLWLGRRRDGYALLVPDDGSPVRRVRGVASAP